MKKYAMKIATNNRPTKLAHMVISIKLGYVGSGYYGGSNEKEIMREIYENGPVVVAFNASPDLYYYSSGVFITNPKNSLGN